MASHLSDSEVKEELINYLLTHKSYKDIDEYISYQGITDDSEIRLKTLYNELMFILIKDLPPIV